MKRHYYRYRCGLYNSNPTLMNATTLTGAKREATKVLESFFNQTTIYIDVKTGENKPWRAIARRKYGKRERWVTRLLG